MFDPWNNDTSSSTSITCSIFLGVDSIVREKKWVYRSILELAPMAFIYEANLSLKYTKIFWDMTVGLYGIKLVAC